MLTADRLKDLAVLAGFGCVSQGTFIALPEDWDRLAKLLNTHVADALTSLRSRMGPRPYHVASPGIKNSLEIDAEPDSVRVLDREGGEPSIKEPCPHERLDDDGGPPRRDWDDFPKVGLDIMAITRSVSGG